MALSYALLLAFSYIIWLGAGMFVMFAIRNKKMARSRTVRPCPPSSTPCMPNVEVVREQGDEAHSLQQVVREQGDEAHSLQQEICEQGDKEHSLQQIIDRECQRAACIAEFELSNVKLQKNLEMELRKTELQKIYDKDIVRRAVRAVKRSEAAYKARNEVSDYDVGYSTSSLTASPHVLAA